MNHIGLFEGIGGFSLAAEWMGWQTVAWCEINEFNQKVLKYYWPDAEGFGDIVKTDFTKYANKIDILTGGFPCQPYSTAGKRKGKEDERHLWPEMLRAIRKIQPGYVVGENVSGLTNWNGGVVFDEVQADLENEGYEVLPFLLPACSVNAPHRRDRIWFIAYSVGNGYGNGFTEGRRQAKKKQSKEYRSGWNQIQREWNGSNIERTIIEEFTPNTGSEQFQDRPQERIGPDKKEEGTGLDNRAERPGDIRNASNTEAIRMEGSRTIGQQEPSTHVGQDLFKRNYAGDNWQDWPTQSPLCSRDDGLSAELVGITFSKHRNESLKGYGNAIVPQVALQIFKAIEQMEMQAGNEIF